MMSIASILVFQTRWESASLSSRMYCEYISMVENQFSGVYQRQLQTGYEGPIPSTRLK